MDLDTTIVAVSSGPGRSSHAMIRVCGDRAFHCAKELGLEPQPRHMHAGRIVLGEHVLPVMCSAFSADASYAGQDTIELQLPNNAQLISKCIQSIIKITQGRHAEAGEFTARAFLNGNISLTEAEGVCATIAANNDAELLGASLLRQGSLCCAVEPITESITKTLALVEAGIDFVEEEDVVAISEHDIQNNVQHCIASIRAILDGHIAMATLRALPLVVIAGKPNAGKSTLFNTLLGKRRVVVSSAAGTTRDAIGELALFVDKEAMLFDIAGLEAPTDSLSESSQNTANTMISKADLVLWCVAPLDTVPEILKQNVFVVHTKGDIANSNAGAICAISGNGIDSLRKRVSTNLRAMPSPQEHALALLPRHERALHETVLSLSEVLEHIQTPELVATSLRLALHSVGAISGQVTPDEVLGSIFSTFCVGK